MTRVADKTLVSSEQVKGSAVAADFQQEEFDILFRDKGYNVIWEKALQCGCLGAGSDHQTNCQNCGGTGWLFVNPTATRMIVTSLAVNKDFQTLDQGSIDMGYSQITARYEDKIGFMDKIILTDSVSSHHEVLFPVLDSGSGNYRASTRYDIKAVEFIGHFTGTGTVYTKLEEGTDYVISNNIVEFLTNVTADNQKVTIRYRHNPVYHIWDQPRETITSLLVKGANRRDPYNMAIRGMGKRAHLILNAENWAGNRLLDNSWDVQCPPSPEPTKLVQILRNSTSQFIYDNLTPSQRVELNALLNP